MRRVEGRGERWLEETEKRKWKKRGVGGGEGGWGTEGKMVGARREKIRMEMKNRIHGD